MPLDETEIAALGEAVKTNTIPGFLKPLADAGITIYTPTQKTEFENTFKGSVITARDKELYGTFETKVKELSGLEKQDGEKASDFLARAWAANATELNDLREAKKGGTLTQVEKDRLKQLEAAVGGHKTEVENLTKKHAQDMLGFRVSGETGAALNGIKTRLKAAYKEGDVFEDIQAARLARFQKEFTPEEIADGTGTKIVYRNVEKNQVQLNDKGAFSTAGEILEGYFTPYIDKAPQQPGGGSPPAGGTPPKNDNNPISKDSYQPSSEVKTKVQLTEDLSRNGFKAGTPEFTELKEKFGKDLPLR